MTHFELSRQIELAAEQYVSGHLETALSTIDSCLAVSTSPDEIVQLQVIAAAAERELGRPHPDRRLQAAANLLSKVSATEIEFAFYVEKFRWLTTIGNYAAALECVDKVRSSSLGLTSQQHIVSLLNEVKVQSAINMACLDRHEEAIRALKDSLNLEQPDGALWFYLGHSEIALKRFTDSLLSLREAARRGVPKNLEPELHYDLAVALSQLGDLHEALAELDHAARCEPRQPVLKSIVQLTKNLTASMRPS